MGFRNMVSPNRGQATHFPPLARQGSLYNLTFDEVQNQFGDLGKPLNSMNLDELLKCVVAAEESLVVQNPQIDSSSASAPSSSSVPCFPNINLSRTLSQKTVDEVWRDILEYNEGNAGGSGSVPRQQSLGEMTLEDFLVCAGAINMGNQDVLVDAQPLMAIDAMVSATQQADWLQPQMVVAHHQPMSVLNSSLPVAPPVFGNPIVDVGYAENQLAVTGSLPMVTTTSSDLLAAAERKHRFSDGVREKAIERRHKRMMKNRESAARSRAKKQAYINELENHVAHLKQTNCWLKKHNEFEKQFLGNEKPKHQLRRTRSAPF